MATPNQKAPQAPAHALLAFLPLDKTFRDAMKLADRFQKAEGFRAYLMRRVAYVIPAVALFALVSIACAAAMVILLAERNPLLALVGMLLAPFVLLGSFFVEAFVFFSWIEGRALAQALGRRSALPFSFGPMPRVPWVLGTLFLVLPLFVLMTVSGTAALVLILLALLIIGAIARFDH